ncbi:hypothetical protein H105_02556 [Trichophyton soudanense CBS 452.61]|uniref:FAD-dependent oxidoreductase 2 FAD-binding domain-containing protein n=1 Tax=Trichophyton soudanense CBS 452.61 TaxID=1215331 RepID=A0A022Y0D0_TRISD|nr:hypothetical protein H105_02556 [Trichophyton soudanense CBS 452.61]
MAIPQECDILVVGSGNAGFSAAISAAENGARGVEWAGGNTYFTAGAFRTVHSGLDDVLPIVNNVTSEQAGIIDMEPYTTEEFTEDMSRMTDGQTNQTLCKALVQDSNTTIKWLASLGVRSQLSFNRQSYKVDGRNRFWGGMSLKTEDGGKGLIQDYQVAARRVGIFVFYSTPLMRLVSDPATGTLSGAVVENNGSETIIKTQAVILAAGDFESNPQMWAHYLGGGWDKAFLRGTPYNVSDCLEIAIRDMSAKKAGDWSGCHSVAWDANAPKSSGDRDISNQITKSGYPPWADDQCRGEKFGRAILAQPGHIAFQVWDHQAISWLREEEYRPEVVEHITAPSISELAEKCSRVGLMDKETFINTLSDYNAAVYQHRKENTGAEWNPAIKDGLSTQSYAGGLSLPKSNWALPLDQGPFLAVKVTCGITFTFGGLAVTPETATAISSANNEQIPGLYCVGEMLGGLFHSNYPGGSGLTSGAVFGRRAGSVAARRA